MPVLHVTGWHNQEDIARARSTTTSTCSRHRRPPTAVARGRGRGATSCAAGPERVPRHDPRPLGERRHAPPPPALLVAHFLRRRGQRRGRRARGCGCSTPAPTAGPRRTAGRRARPRRRCTPTRTADCAWTRRRRRASGRTAPSPRTRRPTASTSRSSGSRPGPAGARRPRCVLRFTSEPLEQPLTIYGWSFLDLLATTNGDDTDSFANLADVGPDGGRSTSPAAACVRTPATGSSARRRCRRAEHRCRVRWPQRCARSRQATASACSWPRRVPLVRPQPELLRADPELADPRVAHDVVHVGEGATHLLLPVR